MGLIHTERAAELDRRLAEEFTRLRSRTDGDAAAFGGLYVGEDEVQRLLSHPREETWSLVDEERLAALQRWFALDDFEISVVLACIAPELDRAYGRIYAFLQDDIAKKRATVGLLLRLCAHGGDSAADARACFHRSSPLARASIVRLPEPLDGPLLEATPVVDERIIGFVLGADMLDERLVDHVRIERDPQPGPLPAAVVSSVAAAAAASRLVVLQGREAARQYARELAHGLLLVDTRSVLASVSTPPAELLRLAFREANLELTVVYLAACDELWADENAHALNVLREQLALWSIPCILDGGANWDAPATVANRVAVPVPLTPPTAAEREAAWRDELAAAAVGRDADTGALAGAFRLTLDQIRDAVLLARSLAVAEGATDVETSHLASGARALSSRRLLSLAQEIVPKSHWQHLVLPEDSIAQLRELCATVRFHGQVLEESGFGERLTGGTGVTALFSGVSGTGKTMAAEVIARDLGLPLFRVSIAAVLSKWLGESEKNVDRVFAAATDSNAILFFDEADALFGKRTETKDSQSHYANVSTSHLLQKMEAYEGVAILATNMRHNLDDAFLRRLTFNVVFPFPQHGDRVRIWEAIWPPGLARADDVDFVRLAHIKLVGGNVKNAILGAAHRAAERAEPVCTADLLHSIRREYQKLGKQMSIDELECALDEEPL